MLIFDIVPNYLAELPLHSHNSIAFLLRVYLYHLLPCANVSLHVLLFLQFQCISIPAPGLCISFSDQTATFSYVFSMSLYQVCFPSRIENATTLYNLIKGLCHNQFVPLDPQNNFVDRQWDYISEVESIMLDLFRKTSTLQQRLHYSISVDANEYSIHSFKLINRYSNINPLSFAFTEFQKMLEWDIPIRCCKNCNKLFIPDTKHAVDYCNRVDSETGLTCKKIGASAQYRSKVNQNPILKEYTKAYKRNYARIGKPGMTNDQFRIWVDEATKKRDELATEYTSNPSEQLVVAFKKYLGNK